MDDQTPDLGLKSESHASEQILVSREQWERLRQSEEKYRALFDSMDEAYAVVEVLDDENGEWNDFLFLEVNPAFLRHTGMEFSVGRKATEILGTPNPRWAQIYGRVAQTGEPARFEESENTLGRTFDLYVFRLGGPGSRRVAVLFTDISERKTFDEALRQSEARARALISNLPGGAAFVIDTQERYVLAEGEALEAVGFSPSDFVGKTLDEALPPELVREYRPLFQGALAGKPFDYEHHSHGRWFLSRGVPLRDGEGITGILVVSYDITARKIAEQRLRSSEENLRLVLESVTEYAILTLDSDGKITSWNPGAQKAFGWTKSEILGQNTEILFTPEDRAEGASQKEMQQARREGRADDERWHIRKDGSRFYVSGVMSPLRDGAGFVKIARDLTREREAEAALHESQERLRAVVSHTPVVQFAVDKDGVFTVSEGRGLEVLGLKPGEVVGKKVAEIYANVPSIIQNVNRALAGETFSAVQNVGPLVYETLFAPLLNGEGEVTGAAGVALDVTQREQALAQVRESEERFRTLSDAVPQVIWTNSANGEANYFNQRWFEFSGLSLEKSLGPGWQTIVHPEDAPASKGLWRLCLETGQIFDAEYRLRRFDGQYRWFIGRNVPLKDADGHVVSWFGSATDIQEIKEAQTRAAQSEERLRIAVDAGSLGTWDWDVLRDAVHWNERNFLLFGLPPQERVLAAKDFTAHLHPEDRERILQKLRDSVENCASFEAEFRIRRTDDGEVRWMNGYGRPVECSRGRTTRMCGVMFDSTERRQAQEVLKRSHEDLENLVEARTHELRGEIENRQQAQAQRDDLMKRIVNTQEEERGRISRELHDNLGQHLTAVMLGLQRLEMEIGNITGGQRKETTPQIGVLRDLVDGLMRAAHRQAWELRPAELDALGLEAALGQYIRDWSGRTGTPVDFQSFGWETHRPSREIETTLYRVVQEALTNVARHANASAVSIILELNPRSASAIVEDNGQGFASEESDGRLGIVGMRERLALVGGTLEIESSQESGTTLFARVAIADQILPKECNQTNSSL